MSWISRLIGSDLRAAQQAEAAGRLEEAAQRYAKAGEDAQVARVQVARAARTADRWEGLELLRAALQASERGGQSEQLREVQLTLAQALVAWVDRVGVMDRRDQRLLEEAANLYLARADFERAGDLFSRIGYKERAQDAYVRGGHIEQLEDQAFMQALQEDTEKQLADLLRRYELAVVQEEWLAAHAAAAQACELAPNAIQYRELRQRIAQRLPPPRRLRLRTAAGVELRLIGGENVTMGRDPEVDLPLALPGVSRTHAQIVFSPAGVSVEDLGSRLGTTVDGRPCAPSQALGPAGTIALGELASLSYRALHGERGWMVACTVNAAGNAPLSQLLCGTWAQWPLEGARDPLSFALMDDYWHLLPAAGGAAVSLDGRAIAAPTLLCLHGRAEAATTAIEVLG